ncbi:unnamed protein product [Schistosoma rodhaini]|uniref:Rhodopsin-like orphan GPCR,putative n=1 Tax=Schistosoma mansoni TaxID=6183 RepID=G4M0H4_SCHMA|nr:rhodopsin-like orphan GPCR,putative [Schistosoma mansoni]CAH8511650.1 unnamed protein product [Schistosoma rodhaini]|eukprot:XP_018646991.1 rhodopsin-like orphan GPCR,putative [Schistosoma mansoni]
MILSIDGNFTEYHPKVHHSLGTLYSVAPIIILIIGIPGNLLSMVIWLRRLSTTVGSTSLLIGIMCMTDTYVIAHGCLRQWIIGITNEKVDIRIKFGCGIPLFLFTFSTDLSTWIIILLCIERAVCVWTPIKFKQWCKLEHGITALIFVVLCLAGVNIHYVWTVYVKDNSCAPKQEYKSFHLYWPYIDFAIYSFIPLAFILLVNISIIWRMKTTNVSTKHTQNSIIPRETLISDSLKQISLKSTAREQRSARVLRTVVCMTISHFLLTMPVVFFYLFESKFCIDNKDWINVCDTIERVTVILQMINHMTHFFIYSCTSSVFLSDLNRLCKNHPLKCCQSVNTTNTRLINTCNNLVDSHTVNCSQASPI